jgi:hypothetical protein
VECAIRVTIQRDRKIDRLGVRGVLHSLDALLDPAQKPDKWSKATPDLLLLFVKLFLYCNRYDIY